MSEPTSPAVSEALREAVTRDDAREKHLADIVDRYVTDCTLVHRNLTQEDVWLLEGLAFGPIASEIARLQAEITYLSGDRDDAREGERRWALRCGTVLGETPEHDAPAEPGRLGFVTMSGRHDQSAWDSLAPEARQRWSYVEGAYLMRADAEIARLTGERDAASDDAGAWEALCGSALERLRAAESETARLRAALEKLLPSKLYGEIWGLPDADTVQIVISFGVLREARAALTSQEKTDV